MKEVHKTKEEITEDLTEVYNRAVEQIKARGSVMMEDKQGQRVAPEWVVVKECVTLLNRIGGIVESKELAKLDLD